MTRREPLYRNANALALSSVASAGLGLLYWIVAARLYPVTEIGRNAVLVNATLILSSFAQLNLGAALPRLLPTGGLRTRRLVAGSYVVTTLFALVLGVLFVVIGPLVTNDLDFVASEPLLVTSFCLGVVLWGIFVLQDAILTGLRQAVWVPVENIAFGLLKLSFLVALLQTSTQYSVFLSWVLPIALLIVPINLFVFRRAIPAHLQSFGHRAEPLEMRSLGRFVLLDYTASIFSNVLPLLLPVIVLSQLGEAANARFYAAWVISISLTVIVGSTSVSLAVEGALRAEQLPTLARKAIRRICVLILPLLLGVLLLSDVILRIYGAEYEGSANALRVLALAAAARAAMDLYHTLARIQRRVHTIVVTDAIACAITLATAVPFARAWGITGVSLSYLCGQSLVALSVCPSMWRLVHGTQPTNAAHAPVLLRSPIEKAQTREKQAGR